MRHIDKIAWFFGLAMVAVVCHAEVDLQEFVRNVIGPATTLVTIVYNICYIIGAGLLVGALVQFKAHRNNPSQVHLSQPVMLFIIGLALIALPIIAQLSSASVTLAQTEQYSW